MAKKHKVDKKQGENQLLNAFTKAKSKKQPNASQRVTAEKTTPIFSTYEEMTKYYQKFHNDLELAMREKYEKEIEK